MEKSQKDGKQQEAIRSGICGIIRVSTWPTVTEAEIEELGCGCGCGYGWLGGEHE